MATGNPSGAPNAAINIAATSVIPPPIHTQEFHGDLSKDKDYTVENFIDHVNKAANLNGWTDEQSVAYATSYTRGPAATFIKKLSLDPDQADNVEQWTTLSPLLKDRFMPQLFGATESANIMKSLVMTKEETFTDFADRCEVAKRKMDLNLSATDKATPGYKAIYKRDTIAFFFNGIPDKARAFLANHHKNKPLDELATIATEFYGSNPDKGVKFNAHINQVDTDQSVEDMRASYIEALDTQLQAWAAGSKSTPFSFTGTRGRGRGRAGAQSNAPNTSGRPRWVSTDAAWKQIQAYRGYQAGKILCFRCWSFGDHYANNCNNAPQQRPTALNLVEPPARRNNRNVPQPTPQRTSGGRQINPIENNPAPQDNPDMASAMASLQSQVGGLTNIVASWMRSSSDTESVQERPPTPYGSHLNYQSGL